MEPTFGVDTRARRVALGLTCWTPVMLQNGNGVVLEQTQPQVTTSSAAPSRGLVQRPAATANRGADASRRTTHTHLGKGQLGVDQG